MSEEQLHLFEDLPSVEVDDGRVCYTCKRSLPLSMYYTLSKGSNVYGHNCKECKNKITSDQRQRYKTAPPIPEDYTCPICLRKDEDITARRNGNKAGWCLDHDHSTGKFRGWLCHSCNRGIGALDDDVKTLERAIAYLKSS